MKVVYEQLPSKRKRCVATIGAFDGIHRGHQLIVKKVKSYAHKLEAESLVISFDVHPRIYARQQRENQNIVSLKAANYFPSHRAFFPGLLTDIAERELLLDQLGVDYFWLLKTSVSLLQLPGDAFVAWINRYFDIVCFVVGEDFRFGYERRDDVRHLQNIAVGYHAQVVIVKRRTCQGEVVSSSRIRTHIQHGEIEKAHRLLGRHYYIQGEVKQGLGKGRMLGFPTANVHSGEYVTPLEGVYAAAVVVGKKVYQGAVNIGRRPTVTDSMDVIVEAHLFDFHCDIVGKTIKIIFLERIRTERKFSTLEALRQAIASDINYIRSRRYRLGK